MRKWKTTWKTWEVESFHPQEGASTQEVIVVVEGCDQSRYCRGGKGLGCSRDYQVPTDQIALSIFLGEHGRKITSLKELPDE